MQSEIDRGQLIKKIVSQLDLSGPRDVIELNAEEIADIVISQSTAPAPVRGDGEAGYVLVPREPTVEMLEAAIDGHDRSDAEDFDEDDWRRPYVSAFRAMIAAAPTDARP